MSKRLKKKTKNKNNRRITVTPSSSIQFITKLTKSLAAIYEAKKRGATSRGPCRFLSISKKKRKNRKIRNSKGENWKRRVHNDKRGKLERQRPRFRLPSFWRNRRRPAIRSQIKQHSNPSLLDNYPGQGNCCAIRRAVTGGDNSGNGDFEPDCTGPRVTLYTSLEVGIGLRRRRRHAVPPHPRDRSIFAPAWTPSDPVDRDSSRNRPSFSPISAPQMRSRACASAWIRSCEDRIFRFRTRFDHVVFESKVNMFALWSKMEDRWRIVV